MSLYIGTSGYNYPHWRGGVFYPEGLPPSKELEYYTKHFSTVELNVSFYRLPKRETFEGWKKRTPKDFIFAVKGSRFITHIKRLLDCEDALKTFFYNASGLGEKYRITLWQLPPGFKMDPERLQNFCYLSKKMAENVRHAFEFRHPSWFCPQIYRILEKFSFSLCIAHSKHWPCEEAITAPFIYIRFHGGEKLYSSEYSMEHLFEWAQKIKEYMKKGLDVYVYFNNDAYGFAVKNAKTLEELCKA